MKTELFWLTLSTLVVALYWVPYVLNRITVQGLMGALQNPSKDEPEPAAWAVRAQKAHVVAIENLPVFAALILISQQMHVNSPVIPGAAMLYFFGMLAHFVLFTLGIPYLRTLAFAIAGFGSEVAVALALLELI